MVAFAIEYALRHAKYGINNNVLLFDDDVVYGKIEGLVHLFHVDELEL